MQILAIVLREHHREPFRSCRDPAPIEVFCNCTEATPIAEASVNQGLLIVAGTFIGGGVVGTCWCLVGVIRHEPAKPTGSRRRGGGVLSIGDSR